VRAVRDAKHELRYYEGTVEDITERRQAQERLRTSETLYHSLVENLPQNIFRKDLQERFTFANQRFCDTLGKPLDEILGKTDFDFFPPELAAKYQQDDHRILETGQLFETVEEHQPPGGDKIYVNVVKTPIFGSDNKIIGLQGIFWDITEKKRAEERLQRTTAELAKSREELHVKNQQMEEDLKMAREIQQSIIPQQYPSFPRSARPKDSALRFCHRYLPTGTVGGDFFNVLALSDTKAGLFICDVMGHGVRSALVTAIIRALVEEMTPSAADPGQLLGHLNRDLRAILKQSGTPLFTTAFYLVADLESRQMCYAAAGHPKQLLVHRSSSEVELLQSPRGMPSPALGLFDHATYPTATASFAANDLVVLFTDGLYDVEGPAQEKFHLEWLVEEVRKRARLPAGDLFDALIAQIRSASQGGTFADDVCLVGMEVA
ncbi:MAG: SpoIIE family protein phosphatase, partial [Verrucomicrobia bacterium]|nr:SpoIIE family protein phosphatase [Verrucomicrobiota bacterium]